MPRAALALLAMLAVSCSTRPGLEDLVHVEGVASLRNGPPLAGMTVSFFTPTAAGHAPSPLAPERPGGRLRGTAPLPTFSITDAQGMFRIRLPEGRWEVWIGGLADSGIMSQHVADVMLRLPVASMDLHYQGYRVSGRLIGPGNATLTDGYLSILGRRNTARAPVRSGGYTFLVPTDTLNIWANPTPIDYEAGIPRVRYDGIIVASDTTIDFSLDGNLVSGKVTGSGGIPMYGGWVAAAASDTTASAYMSIAMDGTYRLYLPTREYVFTVYSGGRGNGTYVYPPILIDSPRTLDFDLSGSP